MASGTERMVITVPASPKFLKAAGMAASALAAQLDFTCDRVSDLRMAVAEACWHLACRASVRSGEGVEISFLVDDAKLAVEVRPLCPDESALPVPLQSLGAVEALQLAVLEGLVDEARVVCDAGSGMCVTLNCFRSRRG